MKQTTTPEGEMFEYTFRINFSDGTFEIQTVEGNSIVEAHRKLRLDEGWDSTLIVGSRDLRPQECLAY